MASFQEHISKLMKATLTSKGHIKASLRQRAAQYATELSLNSAAEADDIPADLQWYLEKMTRHAYKISERDIEKLKSRYSEDEIFELSLSAALGAGLARYERGLDLLTK